MPLNGEEKQLYSETAKRLKGSDRRQFMAGVVKSIGRGGQRLAEAERGWSRNPWPGSRCTGFTRGGWGIWPRAT